MWLCREPLGQFYRGDAHVSALVFVIRLEISEQLQEVEFGGLLIMNEHHVGRGIQKHDSDWEVGAQRDQEIIQAIKMLLRGLIWVIVEHLNERCIVYILGIGACIQLQCLIRQQLFVEVQQFWLDLGLF